MNSQRLSFAYVVGIDASRITLNLKDDHKGQIATHRDGVSNVSEVGALFAVPSGHLLLVLKVQALRFAEPEEAHRRGVGTARIEITPLRNLVAIVVGCITRSEGTCRFEFDSLRSPALGAEAFPLTDEEINAATQPPRGIGPDVSFGTIFRTGVPLRTNLQHTLGRHVAVLGSTGQGKSCLTAAVLQQLVKLPNPRVVVFDVNGEYADAIEAQLPKGQGLKVSVLGGPKATFKIPYHAFGRHGLGRLFLPSERTQRPALNFALDSLRFVRWFDGERGAGLVEQRRACFFDDCRQDGADDALSALATLRDGEATAADKWPHMSALACMVAESHATRQGSRGPERNAFEYGNVSPLITRIRRLVEDPLFRDVVDVEGGPPTSGNEALNWVREGNAVVRRFFGSPKSTWKLHLVDVRNVAHDLMPMVLGGLLELFAFDLFRRGPGTAYPTLLVLEEAHHYLRPLGDRDDGQHGGLAYERLAKEGRKFGVGLWLSTQRPSEVSTTVLSQCGTWVVFRLAGEQDLRAVASASEWVDSQDLGRLSGLPRRQAIVFGSTVSMPTRIIAAEAIPTPRSHDPQFALWGRPRQP